MKKELHLLFDIIFYFILPILVWEAGRAYFSDYVTILISAVPGILYSFYRFFASTAAAFTRMFLFINIVIGLIIDLFSKSALTLLWNDAFYSLGLCILYLATCFTKRPLYYFFLMDIVCLQGHDKKMTKEFFLKKEIRRIFQILTIVNALCELLYTLLLTSKLKKHGVEIYTFSIVLDQLISFFLSGIFVIGFIYLYRAMNEIVVVKKKSFRKKKVKLPRGWYFYLMEYRYFFMKKHFH